jgi:hypothetical protein
LTHHRQVNALIILEGVEQSNQPLALRVGQDITLCKDVSNFIQFEEQLLAHNLQRTNFSGILLLGKEDLSISTLSNLRKDLEITLPETNPTLSEIGSLSANVLLPDRIVCFLGRGRRGREFSFEVLEAVLASADVRQEIEIVIKEVCRLSASGHINNRTLLTELGNIGESFHVRLMQDL